MTTLKGIYALWYREFKVFQRERSRVISSLFMPIFWYFIFGYGIGSIATVGGNYRHFIFPGFLAMVIIFTGLFNGAYIVWDKKMDFLKEVLITPLSRTAIFMGKMLGGMTDALLQACVLLVFGLIIGIPYTPGSVALTFLILTLFAAALVSLGLIIGSFMESLEGYGLVSSFAVYPIFLLSGALYPLNHLPPLMQFLTTINPGTYAVDALRAALLGSSILPLSLNFAILLGFDAVLILIGTWAFNRMKL